MCGGLVCTLLYQQAIGGEQLTCPQITSKSSTITRIRIEIFNVSWSCLTTILYNYCKLQGWLRFLGHCNGWITPSTQFWSMCYLRIWEYLISTCCKHSFVNQIRKSPLVCQNFEGVVLFRLRSRTSYGT